MPMIETKIKINAPKEKVWRVLMDFYSYPKWNSFITNISGQAIENEKITFTAKLPGGSKMTFRSTLLKVRENSELRWLGRLLIPRIFDGEHIFILKDDGEGTLFEQSEIFRGILPSLMSGMLAKTKMGFETMNMELKERVENGI
jgi:hypothetical protein